LIGIVLLKCPFISLLYWLEKQLHIAELIVDFSIKAVIMINIKIDNIEITAEPGSAIIDVARNAGIKIPSMCYKHGYSNHPSCMVCVVKDLNTGKLVPSCAIKAMDGMEISTIDEEVFIARKEALELLLSDHVGDCVAPCQPSCPAGMDIPKMNRLIAQGKFNEALELVKEDIALPLILGYICPAPCEKACRRGQIDSPVSICLLKKYVANEDLSNKDTYFPIKQNQSGKKIAIIGSGPAGLAATFYLLKYGHQVNLFDKNEKPGGSLRYVQLENPLPLEALDLEIDYLEKYGARFFQNTLIESEYFKIKILNDYDAVVIATGDYNEQMFEGFGLETSKHGLEIDKETYQTRHKKIFVCGNLIRSRKMAIHSLAQAKRASTSVHVFLSGKEAKPLSEKFNSKFGRLFEHEFHEYLKESIPDKRIEHENGNLYHFTKEQAMLEASRCMHCDCRKPDNCKLRDYSEEYAADRRKFLFGERKSIKKYFQHESVVYEPEKCIRCNLCVDITVKSNELLGLSSVGRGFRVEINIPFNEELGTALAKTADEVVESCPTGALSFKKNIK
jgi:NADPH-dependent glutamate synthase beta subunit-like oxidoreductase/ferredoxin